MTRKDKTVFLAVIGGSIILLIGALTYVLFEYPESSSPTVNWGTIDEACPLVENRTVCVCEMINGNCQRLHSTEDTIHEEQRLEGTHSNGPKVPLDPSPEQVDPPADR